MKREKKFNNCYESYDLFNYFLVVGIILFNVIRIDVRIKFVVFEKNFLNIIKVEWGNFSEILFGGN